jgi:hypothetical protein
MKLHVLSAIAFVICVVAPAGAADTIDGDKLLEICGNAVRILDGEEVDAERQRDLPYCLGFVTAVRQAVEDEAQRGERFQKDGVECRWHYETGWVAGIDSVMGEMFQPVCHPDGLSAERIARMTVGFLERHPTERRLSGAALVAAAIREPFRCSDE